MQTNSQHFKQTEGLKEWHIKYPLPDLIVNILPYCYMPRHVRFEAALEIVL